MGIGNQSRSGLSRFDRPAPRTGANPGGAESVQGWRRPKLEDARESDLPTGHDERNPLAKGSVRLCSLPLKHPSSSSASRSGAKPRERSVGGPSATDPK